MIVMSMKTKLTLSFCCILGVIGSFSLFSCVSKSLIYPGANVKAIPSDKSFNDEAHYTTFQVSDGTKLRGWFYNRGKKAPLVVMYGGNGMNVGSFINLAKSDVNRSYLMMNYRGYASSEGSPSEKKIVDDACQIIHSVRKDLDHQSSIVLVGFSLGSGVASQVSTKVPTDQLVLICPFDSLKNVAKDFAGSIGSVAAMRNEYDSAEQAKLMKFPVTIFMGTHDGIVTNKRTNQLIRSFQHVKPTVISYPLGHNDVIGHPQFISDFYKILF